MSFMQKFFRTGDSVDRVGGTAHEIDRILTELGELYILRSKATRMGTDIDMQSILSRISDLKAKLSQL